MRPEDTDMEQPPIEDVEGVVQDEASEDAEPVRLTPDEIDAVIEDGDDLTRRCIEQLLEDCNTAAESRQRALADFKNFQRRATEQEQRMHLIVSAGVLRSVLPVLDQLDMALQQDPEQVGSDQILSGVQIVRDELDKVLGEQGVDRIEPVAGDQFDPTQHEAMLKQEAEGIEAGRITNLLQVGYRKSDQVLRAAKVAAAP